MKANIISIAAGKTKVYGQDDNSFTSAYKKDIYFNFCDIDEYGIIEDTQVDKRYHGGVDKAIHMGSAKHFETFKNINSKEMDKLAIGCNILIDSFDEDDICVGDIYSIGDIQIEVSQPRQPCWKIGAIFDKQTSRYITKQSAPGWYARVLIDGVLDINDEMVLEKRVSNITIKQLHNYLLSIPKDEETIKNILNTQALASAYKKDLQRAIEKEKNKNE